jgi:hypothetical protein
MLACPQGEGCPDHPGPLLHWTDRWEKFGYGGSCWACDIRWVHEGSARYEEWLASQMDGEQFRLTLEAA